MKRRNQKSCPRWLASFGEPGWIMRAGGTLPSKCGRNVRSGQPRKVGGFLVWGDPMLYDSTLRILERLSVEVEVIPGITAIQALAARHKIALNRIGEPVLITRRSDLQGRTPHQVEYLKKIQSHDITFGIGPAGTGKTYLAVACAVDAFERDAVKRLVLVRPAVEAGERLGFLPGDLAQKVDPYLRPLYDALYDLMGYDKVAKMFERGAIEVAPLAFMRGRTLNHAFVILDEAQNTTPEQMKMFLTRIGFGSRVVVTGDVTQIDLARGQKSGLVDAHEVLKTVRGIAFTYFGAEDVVRHPLVQRIVNAYEGRKTSGGRKSTDVQTPKDSAAQ